MFALAKDNKQLIELYERLARNIVDRAKNSQSISGFDNKLWLMAKAIVYYSYNVITDEEEKQVEPLVKTLRVKAAEKIRDLPEMSDWEMQLSTRLNEASAQFKFRLWTMDDLDIFISYLDHEEMWRFVPENYPDPLTRETATALIETSNNLEERHQVHAVVWEGKPIGQTRILFESPISDSAEISYWLGKDYWGKGLASGFVTLYTHRNFLANPKINRIYAKIIEGNDASVKVLEKAGYRYESLQYMNVEKYGQKHSTKIFSVFRQTFLL